MSTNNQLIPYTPERVALDELTQLGSILCKTGFFADAREAGQAVAKILAGRELGFAAIASMTGVYIVKGKVSLSANLIAAAIKKSVKYNYRVRQLDDEGCKIEFFEEGQPVGLSTFTRKDAEKAGLLGGDNWKKYPRNMFFARAMSNGAKFYTPDIFGGPIYTPEELGATVDAEGEVIDIQPEATREPEPTAVETEPTEDQSMALADEKPDTPEAELRWLAWKLDYTDEQLMKWLVKKYNINKGLKITEAIYCLGDGALREAISIFSDHVKAKGATQ